MHYLLLHILYISLTLVIFPLQGHASHAKYSGGYATPEEGGGLRMHYYTCDHQGNVRVVMGEDGTLEQVTHYYPFGGIYGDAGLNAEFQPYKYNGKELDRMHGLDWYDYGARQYDAAGVPVFTTTDPMAEKYYHLSPYAYCANNPVKYIDKEGKYLETFWDVANLMVGVYSFSDNISQGNFGAAFVDGVGILADAIATALPILPGGAGAAIQSARLADKATDAVNAANKANDAVDAAKTTLQGHKFLRIEIAPENKIDRSLLNPPSEPGRAPTFKSDGTAVEIHHEGQDPNGPFKEMHWKDHRGKGNFKTNHPNLGQPSKIDRPEYDKAKEIYWKEEYEKHWR